MFEIINEQVLFGLKPMRGDRAYRLENARRIANDMEIVLSNAKDHEENSLHLTLAELASDYKLDGGQTIKEHLDERVKIAKKCLTDIHAHWCLGGDVRKSIRNRCSEEDINSTLSLLKLEVLLKSNPNIPLEQITAMLDRDCALWRKPVRPSPPSERWVTVTIKPEPVWSGLGDELMRARAKAIDDALSPGTKGVDFKPYISTAVRLCWERNGNNQLLLSSKNKSTLAVTAIEARVFKGHEAGRKTNGRKNVIWVRLRAEDDKVRTDCDFIFQARKSRGGELQWFTMRLSTVFTSGDKNIRHQMNIKALKKRLKTIPAILDIQWALDHVFSSEQSSEQFLMTIPADAILFDDINDLKQWLRRDLSAGYKARMLWKWSQKGNIRTRHGKDPKPVLATWLSGELERF